jgi:hypothetical protein
MSWSGFIERAPAAEHAVQVYDELDELAESVGRFLVAGFQSGAPAILIASSHHRRRFAAELEARNWDPRRLEQQGLLTVRDAEQTLAGFMNGERPSQKEFERIVGGLFDAVASRFPDATIRAFGEMVDVLWHAGQAGAAVELEELWDQLQQTRRFALLCAYHLDVFDVDVQLKALPDIFRAHTRVRPVVDNPTLTAALDQALVEIVGPIETARIYLNVAQQVARQKVPQAQAVMGWLSTSGGPNVAKILERTRDHYRSLRALRAVVPAA